MEYCPPAVGELERDEIVRRFAEMWWSDRSIFFGQTWLGIPTLQHPFDAWVTQEIIVETRPERIVEAGALAGGSATMWAMILDNLVPDGRVIAIDLHDRMEKARGMSVFNRRVDFVQGSTVDPAIVTQVRRQVEGRRTMVILDSAHDAPRVAAELDAYAPLVTPGCYLIVQDGFVNGHPLEPDHGPGPYEAVQDFLAKDECFEVDRTRERMLFTFNPSGFLRRR
jgi:cephalosporin hydroxylase